MKLLLWMMTSISLILLSACATTKDPGTPSLNSFDTPKTYYGNDAMTNAHKM